MPCPSGMRVCVGSGNPKWFEPSWLNGNSASLFRSGTSWGSTAAHVLTDRSLACNAPPIGPDPAAQIVPWSGFCTVRVSQIFGVETVPSQRYPLFFFPEIPWVSALRGELQRSLSSLVNAYSGAINFTGWRQVQTLQDTAAGGLKGQVPSPTGRQLPDESKRNDSSNHCNRAGCLSRRNISFQHSEHHTCPSRTSTPGSTPLHSYANPMFCRKSEHLDNRVVTPGFLGCTGCVEFHRGGSRRSVQPEYSSSAHIHRCCGG